MSPSWIAFSIGPTSESGTSSSGRRVTMVGLRAGRIDHAVQHADVGPDAPPLVLGLGQRDRSARWICSSGTPHLEAFAVAEEVGGGTEVVHDAGAGRAGQPKHRLRVVRREGRP